MARRWSKQEEDQYRRELRRLYVHENKTIKEVSVVLGIAPQTVYQRMIRLGVASAPERKATYLNRRVDIVLPCDRTAELAEFFGIMLGDGKLSHNQVVVTLGHKEHSYALYVARLTKALFGVMPKIGIRKRGYRDVYLGSVELSAWLQREGMVYNKVRVQVGVPQWIFGDTRYMQAFLRGIFDTDGSVYRLRCGSQLSFTNRSAPMLTALQLMLKTLNYSPSRVSCNKVYLTRAKDIERFFGEIAPKNPKHIARFRSFRQKRVGTQVVNEGRL